MALLHGRLYVTRHMPQCCAYMADFWLATIDYIGLDLTQ
jgi:hypothetical protein